VIEQILWLQQHYGIREVHFVDPTFTLDRQRTLALCEAIRQLERPLHWTCKTRVDRVDPALLRSMAEAGCYAIAFGVESGHDGMLADVKKALDTRATVAAFEACRAVGVRTIAYCLVGAPGETDETVGATISFVREIRADYVLYGIIDADPVNALTRQAVSRGWLSREDVADHYMSDQPTWLDRHTITGHPLPRAQGWLRRATSDFYLRPQYAFQRVRDLRTLQDMKNLAAGGFGLARDMLRAPRSLLKRGESPPSQ